MPNEKINCTSLLLSILLATEMSISLSFGIGGNSIIFIWSGDITDSSAVISVRARGRLLLGLAVYNNTCHARGMKKISQRFVEGILTEKFQLDELQPNCSYTFVPTIDGVEFPMIGYFRTLPERAGNAANFSFLVSSCAQSGSQHPVYDVMRQERAHFFLHLGDLHYQNIGVNDPSLFASGCFSRPSKTRFPCSHVLGKSCACIPLAWRPSLTARRQV